MSDYNWGADTTYHQDSFSWHSPAWWKQDARGHLETLAGTGREFTSDDLRDLCPEPPHPNAWGSVTKLAAKEGLIRWTGKVVPTRRPDSHGRLIRVWVGCRLKEAQ